VRATAAAGGVPAAMVVVSLRGRPGQHVGAGSGWSVGPRLCSCCYLSIPTHLRFKTLRC
jgi:hypothetical protein